MGPLQLEYAGLPFLEHTHMSFCIQIPVNGSGRRIVIGDVHGCCKTLVHLIEEDIAMN